MGTFYVYNILRWFLKNNFTCLDGSLVNHPVSLRELEGRNYRNPPPPSLIRYCVNWVDCPARTTGPVPQLSLLWCQVHLFHIRILPGRSRVEGIIKNLFNGGGGVRCLFFFFFFCILLYELNKFKFSGGEGSVPWVFLRSFLPCIHTEWKGNFAANKALLAQVH